MITDCPSCSRKLRVPDDLLGKQVKCPTCGHTFQANAAAESAPASAELTPVSPPSEAHPRLELDAPGEAAQPTLDSPPPSRAPQPAGLSEQATQLVPCPNCDKLIEQGVVRCPYCGAVPEDYEEEDERPWEERRFRGRRDAEPHRGVLILVLGIISIVLVAIACGPVGLPLGIAAWVMGHKDLRKMRENIMDDEGMGLTQAGWICGIIGTILDTLCSLGLLAYIAFIFTMFRTMSTMPPPTTAPTIKKTAPAPQKTPAAPRKNA